MQLRLITSLVAGILGAATLAATAPAAEPVFQDSFKNLEQWSKAEGADPTQAKLKKSDTTLDYMALGNGVARAELPDVIDESFVLSFRALNCDWERGLWVGLFNAEGTQGYAAAWDSSKEAYASGQGFVSIVKFDLAKPVAWADQFGKQLTEPTASGQKAVNSWPPVITLSWDKPSGTLTLKVGNVIKGRAVDKSFKSFARVYARGNERSVFADMSVMLKSATTQPTNGK